MTYQSRQQIAQDLIEAVHHFSDAGALRYDGLTFSIAPVSSRDFPQDTNYQVEIRKGSRRVFVYNTSWDTFDRRIVDQRDSAWRERARVLIELHREGFADIERDTIFEPELQNAVQDAWRVVSYCRGPAEELEGEGIALRYNKRRLEDVVYCAIDGIDELQINARGSAMEKNRLKIFYRGELVINSRRLSKEQEPLSHSRKGRSFLDPLDLVVDFISLGSRSLRMSDDDLDPEDIEIDDIDSLS